MKVYKWASSGHVLYYSGQLAFFLSLLRSHLFLYIVAHFQLKMRHSLLLPAAALFSQALGQLNELAVAKGLKYFGTATENGAMTDAAYTAILDNTAEFGQLTPANGQKWDSTEPSQGTFSFTSGDVVPARAKANGQLLRCHTLVWYSQLPSWVSGGTWTNATLTEVMKNHITEVMTHYKGQCYAWDVVNEAFNEDGTYRDSVFFKTVSNRTWSEDISSC